MARTITLMVREGDKVVDGPLPDRPVRLLPSGGAGAVYVGQVYPLYVGDVIDLNDAPLTKAECPGFVAPNQKLVYERRAAQPTAGLPLSRTYLESNRFGHYLVFDATQEHAELVADRLRKSPLGLIRWGESYRPADDGNQYDWFARLEFRGSRAQCLAELESLVATRPLALAADSSGRARTLAVADRSSPLLRVADAVDEAAALGSPPTAATGVDTLVATQAELAELHGLYAALLEKVEREIRPLALRAQEADDLRRDRDALQSDVRHLQTAIEKLTARHEALQEQANELRQELARARAENAQLHDDAEAARLQAEAATRETETSQSVRDQLQQLMTRSRHLGAELVQERAARAELERRVREEFVPQYEEFSTLIDRDHKDQADRNQKYDDRIQKQEGEIQKQEVEIQILHAEKLELQNEVDELRRADKRSRRVSPAGLDQWLPKMFPHLLLTAESVDVMEGEFPLLEGLFQVLAGLQRNDGTVPYEPTVGFPGVCEVEKSICTGNLSGDPYMGRVYFRKMPDDKRLWVFVHRKQNKKEQDLFLKKIANKPFPRPVAA